MLARLAPETLTAINAYPPVVIMDALFVLLLTLGFILFGISTIRAHITARWIGILIIIGWPLFMIGSAIALLVFEPLYFLSVLGAALLSLGLGDVGYSLWSGRQQMVLQPSIDI